MTPDLLDRIALIAGVVLSIMVFSYLLGDNFLYRIAIHILIGAVAAYTLIVAVESVLIPWYNLTMRDPAGAPQNFAIGVIPLLIGILLLFKLAPRLSRIGNFGLAVLLGVGTAVALWGAIVGTAIPLAMQTARGFTPQTLVEGFVVLVGTITVLVYFTYLGVRRSSGDVVQILPVRLTGLIGQAFIVIALGATYALLITTALTILTSTIAERLAALRPGG